MSCPSLIGSVATAATRWGHGFDPRGTSFWFAYDSGGVTRCEEWDLTTFTLIQTVPLTIIAADFFGGDGAGGVVYMNGATTSIERQDSLGNVTTLLSPTTVFAAQDGAGGLVNIARTTFSAPFFVNIDRVAMDGTVTNLVTGLQLLDERLGALGFGLAATPDGAVWFREGHFAPTTLSRYSVADGYSHGMTPSDLSGNIVPRPDNTVVVSISGVLTVVAPDGSMSASPCGATEFNAMSGTAGQTDGARTVAWTGARTSGAYPIYEWRSGGGWSIDEIRF